MDEAYSILFGPTSAFKVTGLLMITSTADSCTFSTNSSVASISEEIIFESFSILLILNEIYLGIGNVFDFDSFYRATLSIVALIVNIEQYSLFRCSNSKICRNIPFQQIQLLAYIPRNIYSCRLPYLIFPT